MSIFVRAALVTAVILAAAPVEAQVAVNPGNVATPMPVTGEQVFQQVCQACHMPDAKGGTGAATIPALARNPVLGDARYPITMALYGRGAMPGFNQLLTPAQIANVVGYVRTHFGNDYPDPVTEANVKTVMAARASIGAGEDANSRSGDR